MNVRWFPTLLAAAVISLASACHRHDHPHGDGEHDHAEDDHGHGDHSEHGDDEHDHGDDHGHSDHGTGAEVVTVWGDTTQLFVEFPPLVVAEDSAFAAHLTRLSDHQAIASGTATVELSGGEHPTERFTTDAPSQAGIFRPVVRPAHPGPRDVTLRLDEGESTEIHRLGSFTVHATRAESSEAAGDTDEGSDEISYLLEQQWVVPFGIARARTMSMRPTLPGWARLVLPADATTWITAPRDGRLLAAADGYPSVGDDVTQGTALFRLTSSVVTDADHASLDLAVEQSDIRVSAARREVERLTPLVSQGVVPQRRLDEATSALAAADAERRSANRRRTSLAQSQQLTGDTDALGIPSPLDGEIAEVLVAAGSWVSAGQPLARIVDRSRMVVDVEVPEVWVGDIGEVTGAWFETDGASRIPEVARGDLVAVGTEVDAITRTLPLRFRLDNTDGRLFAGMSAQAHLIADSPRDAVAVPTSALVDDGGVDVVYVQTGGETFERRPVRLGIRDGDWVEVNEGVGAGEWVVVAGAYGVKLASSSTESVGHGHAH